MSQYPPPFQPPQGPLGYAPYNPAADVLRPARIASVMLWILGGLGTLCGVCVGAIPWVMPLDRAVAEMRAQLRPDQVQQFGNVDLVQVTKIVFTGAGVLALLAGLLLIITAAFVRRGSRGAAITAMVECILVVLWCVLCVCAGLIQVTRGTTAGIGAVALWLAIAIAVSIVIYWLARALQASGMVRQQQQYQAQYLQYMQQHMGPGQGGYGYGSPGQRPPPPPPPPPPQSPPV